MSTAEKPARYTAYISIDELLGAERNPKRHAQGDIEYSLDRFGYVDQIVIDERTGRIVSGHGRLKALRAKREAGVPPPEGVRDDWAVPVTRGWASKTDSEAEAYLAAANQLTIKGGWDQKELFELLDSLDDLEGTGFTLDQLDELAKETARIAEEAGSAGPRPSLADRFLVPPFSVLDARQGYWQERKRRWLDLGIESELGRGDELLYASDQIKDRDFYRNQKKGRAADASTYGGAGRKDYVGQVMTARGQESGISVFDPVLCELAYRWFSPQDGAAIDPFAGGSVRGVLAGLLGRSYTGIDLRAEQVAANELQKKKIAPEANVRWIAGDSAAVLPTLPEAEFDLLFTCPPYFDLEKYSDDPADLSAMKPDAFDVLYEQILIAATARLKENRFAVVVTGNVRSKAGDIRDLRELTVRAFKKAGAVFVNDAILVTMVGSLPVRAGRSFEGSRSLGRTHQEVLVFCKGDRKLATQACGPVTVEIPENEMKVAIDSEIPPI